MDKILKFILNRITLAVLFGIFFVNSASAAGSTSVGIGITNPLKAQNIQELIGTVTKFIFTMALIAAPLLIVVAGLMYITAAGDEKRITSAKNIIKYTVIGLVIIFLSRGLVSVLQSVLGA